jgi:thymidine kinase
MVLLSALVAGVGGQQCFSSDGTNTNDSGHYVGKSGIEAIRNFSPSVERMMKQQPVNDKFPVNAFFVYGCMGSGKGREIHALLQKLGNENVAILKAVLANVEMPPYTIARQDDDRDPVIIPATKILTIDNIKEAINGKPGAQTIVIDEVHFFSKATAAALIGLVRQYPNKQFLLYGLKDDFADNVFEASQVLIENISSIEKVDSRARCHCEKEARHSTRIVVSSGKVSRATSGEQMAASGVDGDTIYTPECSEHHNSSLPIDEAAYQKILLFDRKGKESKPD